MITYTFKKDVDKSSWTYKSWKNKLFESQNWKMKKGEYPELEEDIVSTPRTLNLWFNHWQPEDFNRLFFIDVHPLRVWLALQNKRQKIEEARKPPPIFHISRSLTQLVFIAVSNLQNVVVCFKF